MEMVNVGSESSETTIEIKIKTMDSQTRTLRVDKYVSIPELKERVASLTGVVSEQQRLICRGKLLTDDQILAAYHVEDGHTLHLVVRERVPPTPENIDHSENDPTSSDEHNPEEDDELDEITQAISSIIGRFIGTTSGVDGERIDLNVTRYGFDGEGIDLNHPPFPSAEPDFSDTRNSSRVPSDQAAIHVDFLQPSIMPDSLIILRQYASHLSQEFLGNTRGQSASAQSVGFSWSEGSTASAVHSSDPRGALRPESLAEVMSIARQLLDEQANVRLSQLAEQLQSQSSVTDPLERNRIQSNAMRLGPLIQCLGSFLVDLGRTMMTLRMGQTPAQASVCVGPPVFVSSSGPNPIMVQPHNLQPGSSSGSVPSAAANTTGFAPRNFDFRIRTASPYLSRREQTFIQNERSRVAEELAAAAHNRGPVTNNRSPDSATHHQNNSGSNVGGGVGIENFFTDFFTDISASAVRSHTSQDAQEAEPESGVSGEAVRLSSVLRQLFPIVSTQNPTTTNEDAQTQDDDGNNPNHASSSRCPHSQQSDSKRQRMG